MEFILLAIGVFAVGVVIHNIARNEQRNRWRSWRIENYRITLRYDARSLNFDGDVLGDMTTLTVVDSEIVDVVGTYSDVSSIEEYERFTIEGLFDLVSYYSTVQYDTVYGYPTRLGDQNHWVIEVISFESLN